MMHSRFNRFPEPEEMDFDTQEEYEEAKAERRKIFLEHK